MQIKVETDDITGIDTPALVVNLFQGVTQPGGATGAIDQALDGAISLLIQDGEVKGNLGEITLVHTLGKIAPARVVVAGPIVAVFGGERICWRPSPAVRP